MPNTELPSTTKLVSVNGLETEVAYDHHAIDEVLVPALRHWISSTRGILGAGGTSTGGSPRGDRCRHYAFLAAPPGAGKSTLAVLLENALSPALQCVGLDGFHLPQTELEARNVRGLDGRPVPLATIKGAPETFNLPALTQTLERGLRENVTWPRYDRTLHDIVLDGPELSADHVLVEGNWLLLDEPGWREIARFASFTIFMSAPEPLLRQRLVQRKVRGGLTLEAADEFYKQSDGPNVRRVLDHSARVGVDIDLTLDAHGTIHER